jgi:ABC-type sugar transport system permease subunit
VPYLFIIVPLTIYFSFTLGPVLFSLFMSFHQWSGVGNPIFVGISNYRELATDVRFVTALRNTAQYVLSVVPAQIVIALLIATIVMERWFRFRTITRTVYFMPVVVSEVAVAMVWMVIYQPTYGLLNAVLGLLNIGRVNWLGDSRIVLHALAFMAVWRSLGYYMVIFMAGLSGIPYSLYEASALDGANKRQTLWHVTLPLLRPTILFALVIACIGAFQVFGSIYLMTGGGPRYASTVITWMIYDHGFRNLRMGYASSIAWVLFVIIFGLGLAQMRLLQRDYSY